MALALRKAKIENRPVEKKLESGGIEEMVVVLQTIEGNARWLHLVVLNSKRFRGRRHIGFALILSSAIQQWVLQEHFCIS